MFDYFYNRGAESFNFIRVPWVLIEDEYFKNLSTDAILLYSIMLQRASLSYKNKWFDEEGRIFIYFTVNEVMNTFKRASEKSAKIMKELENIGLIEKKRQGLGKPNVIYVKDFMSAVNKTTGNRNSRTSKIEIQNFEKENSRISKIENQESRNSKCSNKEISNIDNSKIDKSNFKKSAYGSYKNVFLSDDEYEELKNKIPYLKDLIERLSNYMVSSGSKYKDHKATLMTWYLKEKKQDKKMIIDDEEYYKTDLGL